MSLLTTYTTANYKPQSYLAIRYAVEFVEDGYMFRTTRTADKRYSYIGMTRDAAEACRLAKIAQYTRKYVRMDSSVKRIVGTKELPGIEEVTECAAQCFAVRDHDGSWRCDITVKETDVMTTENPVDHPEELFDQWANERTYDEPLRENIFKIVSASVETSMSPNSTIITTSHDDDFFEDFAIANIELHFKTSASAIEWTNAPYTVVDENTVRTYYNATAGTLWRARYRPYSTAVVVSD